MTKLGKLKEQLHRELLGAKQELAREVLQHAVQQQNDQEAKLSLARLHAKILGEAPKPPRTTQPQVTQDGDTGICTVVIQGEDVVFCGALCNYWRDTVRRV